MNLLEFQYHLRKKLFNIILKILTPLLPWLAKQSWAWYFKNIFFTSKGKDEAWLANYGPDWDSPAACPGLNFFIIADLRGCKERNRQQLISSLHRFKYSSQVYFIDEETNFKKFKLALSLALSKSNGIWLYMTANCIPHDLLISHYANAVIDHPDVHLWYSDEVRKLPEGEVKVFCKPGWDPLYQCYKSYIGECFGICQTLAAQIISDMEDSFPFSTELFNLALNMSESGLIGHIPIPLYTAESSDSFNTGRTQNVPMLEENELPLVSIIIPFRDRLELLKPCLSTILEVTDYSNLEIILVDNGSQDSNMISFLKTISDKRINIVTHDIPFNFSALVNKGVAAAKGEIVVLLNNDITIISPLWLKNLVKWTIHPQVGIVGAKLLYPNGLIQHGGMLSGIGLTLEDGWSPPGLAHVGWPGDSEGYFGLLNTPRLMTSVAGAAMAVSRDFYWSLGGFDENLAVAMNDVDFCLKAWEKSKACVWTPEAVLIHHESASRQLDRISSEKMARLNEEWAVLKQRWGERLKDDPWYNPNLSSESSYELRIPPLKRKPRILPIVKMKGI